MDKRLLLCCIFVLFRHNEAVQSMQFNPVSHQLLSCSLSDIAFWSAEQKAVQKHKSGGRVNCCAWTKDGQYLALGLATGYVSIRNKVCYFQSNLYVDMYLQVLHVLS